LFQVFEHFIKASGSSSPAGYETFLKAIEGSKQELMSIGYDEIAIEDFYDLFLGEVKKLPTIEKSKADEHLMKLLCNKEEATYLIMYARFLTSLYLKQNSFLFEDFVGDVHSFCMREVEAVDLECDHP
jgi:ubiquitin thioesterase protein OTUB1